ncbi:hypothetical protein CASFOL_007908 [Castilleja foliolosa]|uniref:H(+)-transporting two-sector ATPase n=1 Tax=Castilleja foliolosa TaxID=1961234 RepID=A0ABD3E5Y8_9LAMI
MRINPTTSGSGVSTLEKKNLGRIIQIIGPVLDVAFPPGKMPNIYNALVVKGRDTVGQPINVTCEVQQLLGNNRVRAVAMSATEGLMRGMEVIDTGAPLSVPVGGATLGRIFNVLGEPVDNLGPVDTRTTFPIHRSAPAFIQLDTKLSIFETGIKVVDLLAPYRRGGKIGLFGGAGVGKTVLIMELINNIATKFFHYYEQNRKNINLTLMDFTKTKNGPTIKSWVEISFTYFSSYSDISILQSELYVSAGLIWKTSRDMQEQTILIGNIPLMNSLGTSIVNGISSGAEGIARIEIQKRIDLIQVVIFMGFPKLLIESRPRGIEELQMNLQKEFHYVNRKLNIAITRITKPYRNPNILAEFIAGQLKNRVSFRKAMKKAIELTEQADTKGIQVQISGELRYLETIFWIIYSFEFEVESISVFFLDSNK